LQVLNISLDKLIVLWHTLVYQPSNGPVLSPRRHGDRR
jgi:hypothetical protein